MFPAGMGAKREQTTFGFCPSPRILTPRCPLCSPRPRRRRQQHSNPCLPSATRFHNLIGQLHDVDPTPHLPGFKRGRDLSPRRTAPKGRGKLKSHSCVGDRFKARRRQPNDVCGPTAASGAAGARRSIACCLVEAPAPRQADSRSRPFSPLHLALAEQWRQDQWTVVDQTPAEPPSILRRSRSQCV